MDIWLIIAIVLYVLKTLFFMANTRDSLRQIENELSRIRLDLNYPDNGFKDHIYNQTIMIRDISRKTETMIRDISSKTETIEVILKKVTDQLLSLKNRIK